MSQVVSNNVALFFSIFVKHTEKQSLIGRCIYIDGHTPNVNMAALSGGPGLVAGGSETIEAGFSLCF